MVKPEVGDVVVWGGEHYEVVTVDVRLTPFRKKDQLTRIEGYTLGVRSMDEEAVRAEEACKEEAARKERLEKARQDREDRKVSAYAVGSFEFNVRLRRGFSGMENMAEFLRIGKRDTKERIEDLLRDPEFQKLTQKHDIIMKLVKISPSITATFEVKD